MCNSGNQTSYVHLRRIKSQGIQGFRNRYNLLGMLYKGVCTKYVIGEDNMIGYFVVY